MYPAVCPAFFIGNEQEMAEKKLIWSECKSSRKKTREARLNMNLEKSEIADVLGVTVEHYRKLEAGVTGISVDKVLTLYHKYGIDPTYLITGESSNIKDFNLDYYVANSTKEQRNDFFDRVLAYLSKLIR